MRLIAFQAELIGVHTWGTWLQLSIPLDELADLPIFIAAAKNASASVYSTVRVAYNRVAESAPRW